MSESSTAEHHGGPWPLSIVTLLFSPLHYCVYCDILRQRIKHKDIGTDSGHSHLKALRLKHSRKDISVMRVREAREWFEMQVFTQQTKDA